MDFLNPSVKAAFVIHFILAHTCQFLRIEMWDKEKTEGLCPCRRHANTGWGFWGYCDPPLPLTGLRQSSDGVPGGKAPGSWVVVG